MTVLKRPGGVNNTPYSNANNFTDRLKKIQEFNNTKGIKTKGFTFNVSIGTTVPNNIVMPGDARMILGVALTQSDDLIDVTFQINNENVLLNCNSGMLSLRQGLLQSTEKYYPIYRPVSGTDTLGLTFQNNSGAALTQENFMIIYI